MNLRSVRRGIKAVTVLSAVVMVVCLGVVFTATADRSFDVPVWLMLGISLIVLAGTVFLNVTRDSTEKPMAKARSTAASLVFAILVVAALIMLIGFLTPR